MNDSNPPAVRLRRPAEVRRMSGGDCGCGCAGTRNCGGAQRNWSAVTGAPQDYAGSVYSAQPLMAGVDDDPEALGPVGTSPAIPGLPSMPSMPSLPAGVPDWAPWFAGGLLLYLLVR